MLEMTHRTFYLFLGRVHSPSQQVLHKVFDIRRGELLLAREIALPRLTDSAFKAYRNTAPDTLRDVEDIELVNIVKNKSSVFLIFQLSCADVDRLFGIRIRAEKPVPEQVVYDMIAEVTNIMCFEPTAVSLLMQETINLNTIPSTISTISACTSITDEGKVLFAVGLLALCLMTVTPFTDTPKRIHHLILDLTEYEFTLESSMYSDALVDMVSRMCIIAGPCAPLDGLPIAFNEIVTVPIISRFIKDIDEYCKVEPEVTSTSKKASVQLLPCDVYDSPKQESIVNRGIDAGSNQSIPAPPEYADLNDTVSLLLKHDPDDVCERTIKNDMSLPTVYINEPEDKGHQDIPVSTTDKKMIDEHSTKHIQTVHMYTDPDYGSEQHRIEPYTADSWVTPFRSTSAHSGARSANANIRVGNKVVDVVTTAYLSAGSLREKGRCKSVSFENNRQYNYSTDTPNLTLIARREYVKYY